MKVRVEGGDLPYFQPLADRDQGNIGKVNGQIRILLSQFDDAE